MPKVVIRPTIPHYFVFNLTVMKNWARPHWAFILLLFIAGNGMAQADSLAAVKEIKKFQQELDREYRDRSTSPLGKHGATHFAGHDFFSVNLKFRVVGRLKVTSNSPFFLMKTQEYKDYLFFPFTDLTNGEESYSGGRYIDLHIPEGEEIVIDFNKAYNPYCAYASGFSCPIVPKENHLSLRITAGIKYQQKK